MSALIWAKTGRILVFRGRFDIPILVKTGKQTLSMISSMTGVLCEVCSATEDTIEHRSGRRPSTAEAWVRSQASPCEIYGGQSGAGIGFFSEYFGLPLPTSSRQCSIISFVYDLLVRERQMGKVWETFKTRHCRGNQDREKYVRNEQFRP
jgi:hypothetical protein